MSERVILFKYLADTSQAEAGAAKLDSQIDTSGKRAASGYAQAAQKAAEYSRSATQAAGATRAGAADLERLTQLYQNVARSQGASSQAAQTLKAEIDALTASTRQSTQATTGAATATAATTSIKPKAALTD